MVDEWYKYHDRVIAEKAIEWCEEQKLDHE
jgi:hypothetical protein